MKDKNVQMEIVMNLNKPNLWNPNLPLSHSYACPEDCGGVREERREESSPSFEGEFQQPSSPEFIPEQPQPPQEPPQEFPAPIPNPETSSEGSGESAPAPSSEPSSSGESSGGGEPTPTGAVIFNFNDEFSNYYFR